MDRLSAMRVLIRTVDAGSLSAAARQMGMPVSTVSRQISALEADIGAQLLSRSTRRMGLTDAGRDYVIACRRILGDLEYTERIAGGEYSSPRGELTITAPVMFGRCHLLPLIIEFLEHYPDIDVRLVQSDRVIDLFEEHVDIALRIGVLPNSSLIAVPVGKVRRVVCGSPEYLSLHGAPCKPVDLASHTCIAHEVLLAPNAWSFDSWTPPNNTALRARLRVNDVEVAIDAAIQGFGLARVLRYQVAEAIKCSRLMEVLVDDEPAALPVNLLYSSRAPSPLKLRAFLDFARPRLRQLTEKGILDPY